MTTPINDNAPDPTSASDDLDAGDENSVGAPEADGDDADTAGSAFPPDNSFGQVPDFNE